MKWINDTFGHEEGDRALLDTKNIFSKTFRTSDIVARIGGDEFAIIAVDATRESTDILLDRLQKNIKALNSMEGRTYEISLSIGSVYVDCESSLSINEMLAKADALMYDQKKQKSGTCNL
jgi:diguanylate cyclase (GGDEF)-like protein